MYITGVVGRSLKRSVFPSLLCVGLLGCGDSQPTNLGNGSVLVRTNTSGTALDASGFTVVIEGITSSAIGINDSVRFSNIPTRSVVVELQSIAVNCSVQGSDRIRVQVPDGGSKEVGFEVTCGNQADLTVSVTTRGSTLRPESFDVNVDQAAQGRVGSDQTIVLPGIAVGDREVALADIPNSCAVSPVSQTVPIGGDTIPRANFRVDCEAKLKNQIVFVTTEVSGVNRFEIVNPDGSGRLVVPDAVPRKLAPAISPDGSSIAFWNQIDGNDGDIWVMTVEGDIVARTTDDGDHDPDRDRYPSWSPDASQLVFSTGSRLRLADVDGGNLRELAAGWVPVWSPDGATILFVRNFDFYTVAPDGTQEQRVTASAGADNQSNPSWSRDGSRVAFATADSLGIGENDVFVMNSDGSGLTQLTSSPGLDEDPAWSPDGSRLVFCSDRDGVYAVYTMNADGTHVQKLTTDQVVEVNPFWSK